MDTPIRDFATAYAQSGVVRFHMPGHKGRPFLGCEPFDITEIAGADELYAPAGIIAQSEDNASLLFGSRHSFYATEGSSQCIRAMLHLATLHRRGAGRPTVLAGRNAHKTFVTACALLDLEVHWLYPAGEGSLCACPLTAADVEAAFEACSDLPCAVYVTSPDYLGTLSDIAALGAVCRRRGVPLLVDNAHGAYLRFLQPSAHPLDLGADLCCDSAHKTLPVLTGGAYLHVGRNACHAYEADARNALALFGSTSPSYLILQSLDVCNRYLAEGYAGRLAACCRQLATLRLRLERQGLALAPSEPLKLVFAAAEMGTTGQELAALLRRGGVECEYAEADFLVLMATPENAPEDYARLEAALADFSPQPPRGAHPPRPKPGPMAMTIREALLAPQERLPLSQTVGRICASPTVACPPAIPLAVSGERITAETAALFAQYGQESVCVVKE